MKSIFKMKYSFVFILSVLLVSLLSSVVFGGEIVKYPDPGMNLEGQTVKINMYGTQFVPFGADFEEPSIQLENHIKKVEEMFNCKIEITFKRPEETIGTLREDVMAGQVNYHLLDYHNAWLVELSQGFVHELSNILDKDFYEGYSELAAPRDINKGHINGSLAGKVYGIKHQTRGPNMGYMIAWNKDLFERLDLPNLYDLYEEGNWTWEAFEDICYKATQDTDGDGENDQVGALMLNHLSATLRLFVASNNGRYAIEQDGKLKIALNSPEVIEALEFLKKLARDGVLHSAFLEQYNHGEDKHIGHAMYIATNGFASSNHWAHEAWEAAEMGYVPLPKGPNASSNMRPPVGDSWYGVVPITIENPREIIEVYSALKGIKAPYVDTEALVEKQWDDLMMNYSLYDRKTVEIWKEIATKLPRVFFGNAENITVHNGVDFDGIFQNEILLGESSVSTVVSEIMPQAQSYLNDLLGY